MLLFNRKGSLLLGERDRERGHWQLPQGGAEPRYSPRENVIRELREELGIKRRHLGKIIKLSARHEYEWETPPAYGRGRWRGQKQTFWVVEFLGDDSDIDLRSHEVPEFQSWRWCSVNEVKRRVPKFRMVGYRAPLQEFLALKRTGRIMSNERPLKRSKRRGS